MKYKFKNLEMRNDFIVSFRMVYIELYKRNHRYILHIDEIVIHQYFSLNSALNQEIFLSQVIYQVFFR